jgi:hypothetical protein
MAAQYRLVIPCRPLDRAAPFAVRLEIVVDHGQAGGPALRLMVTA